MKRIAFVALLLTSVLTTSTAAYALDPVVQPVRKQKVEIVFALDTTGSMGGLIDGAKRKIWSIANEVQRAQQKPEVRIGLVAFRDRGDEYVTRSTPLTNDLDKIYETLMALQADGGGDTPEDVNEALNEAITKMKWSEDKDTLKMVFLVGDAPPHMDYEQQVKWQRTAQNATRRNIFINTVQCGADAETTTTWKAIAMAAEGRYALIPQDGGVNVAINTPFDDELKNLAAELDKTYLTYGTKEFREEKTAVRTRASTLATEAAPAPVAADRASFKAAAAPKASEDLVDLSMTSGGASAALGRVSKDALPDELKGKSAEEQKKYVDGLANKRAEITKKIAEVSKKRDAHVKSAAAKAPKKSLDSFDSEVVETLHEQAAEVGLTYE